MHASNWNFAYIQRNLINPFPQYNYNIDLRYVLEPLMAVSNLKLVPYPPAILKFYPLNSLDYRTR